MCHKRIRCQSMRIIEISTYGVGEVLIPSDNFTGKGTEPRTLE